MAAPEELPLPSREQMLQNLIDWRPGYEVDYARSSIALGRITLLAVCAPTAAGKSTLIREVLRQNDRNSPKDYIHQYVSSTTRGREDRDGDDYVTADEGMTLEKIYEAVTNETLVNYYVHPSGHVYGTFLDGFKPNYTIGAIGTDSLLQLQMAGFREVFPVYTVMDAKTYENRLNKGRLNDEGIMKRFTEGLASIDYAKKYADEFHFVQLSNEPGQLERAADTVGRIARHDTTETLSQQSGLELADEMEWVIRRAIRQRDVQ